MESEHFCAFSLSSPRMTLFRRKKSKSLVGNWRIALKCISGSRWVLWQGLEIQCGCAGGGGESFD